jgi:hypothetical protein
VVIDVYNLGDGSVVVGIPEGAFSNGDVVDILNRAGVTVARCSIKVGELGKHHPDTLEVLLRGLSSQEVRPGFVLQAADERSKSAVSE